MKILLFRSNNIFDSRVNKYHNYFERAGLDYTIVGWDRVGKGWQKEHYDFCRYKAGEDVGGLKAIRNHITWMRYVYKYLKKHNDVTTIHACDLNSAFPAAVFKAFHKRDVTLIFDACDWFSANFADNKFLQFCFNIMERFTYSQSDELIICETERKKQIQFKLNKEPLVMRNIPEIDMSLITPVQDKFRFNNDNPTIAYMGGFADSRFLMELLILCESEPVNLLIAGYGNKDIVHKCDKANRQDNVKYFGRVDMVEGLNMENAADVIYAMYCKVNPNHIYAAPNKYYEAMLLGKPIITTKGTIPGDKVEYNDTGWSVEENIEDMRLVLRNLKRDEIERKGKNAKKLWNDKFKNDLNIFFDNIYSKVIK